MNKPTPGPWKFDEESEQIRGPVTKDAPDGIISIASVFGLGDFSPHCIDGKEDEVERECNANGRLLGEAPNLLKALKRAEKALEAMGCLSVSNRETKKVLWEKQAELRRIRKAIAKAEGRKP